MAEVKVQTKGGMDRWVCRGGGRYVAQFSWNYFTDNSLDDAMWLKIFEMFTGCTIYTFDILKQTPISGSVTVPEKLLKRNQARSQPLVCGAVSNLKANSSLTRSRFCAGGSKPLTAPLSASQIMSSVKDHWFLMIRWPPYWEAGPGRAICIANKMAVTKLQLTLNITKSAV